MRCRNCQRTIPASVRFCAYCGTATTGGTGGFGAWVATHRIQTITGVAAFAAVGLLAVILLVGGNGNAPLPPPTETPVPAAMPIPTIAPTPEPTPTLEPPPEPTPTLEPPPELTPTLEPPPEPTPTLEPPPLLVDYGGWKLDCPGCPVIILDTKEPEVIGSNGLRPGDAVRVVGCTRVQTTVSHRYVFEATDGHYSGVGVFDPEAYPGVLPGLSCFEMLSEYRETDQYAISVQFVDGKWEYELIQGEAAKEETGPEWEPAGTLREFAISEWAGISEAEYAVVVRARTDPGYAPPPSTPTPEPTPALTPVPGGTPLVAVFLDVPPSHNGEDAVQFQLRFSEPVSTSYKVLRDIAIQAVNGTVLESKRVDKRNDLWMVTVEPDGVENMIIRLSAPPDCGDAAAVCTRSGKALKNSPWASIPYRK